MTHVMMRVKTQRLTRIMTLCLDAHHNALQDAESRSSVIVRVMTRIMTHVLTCVMTLRLEVFEILQEKKLWRFRLLTLRLNARHDAVHVCTPIEAV
jgi:hypothetical protein